MVYIFAVLKNVIYGLSVFFTQGLTENVSVLDVLALRFLLSAVVMWLLKVTGILKINIGIKNFIRKNERMPHLKTILLTGLFEPVLYMFFETLGLSMTTGVTAAVILSLAPVSACIMEMIFLKETSTLMQKVFLSLGIAGAVYIALNTTASDGKDTLLGMAFIVMAVVTGSLFSTFSRKSSKHFSAMDITYISCLLGAVIFNSINVVRHLIAGDIASYFLPYFNLENMIGFIFLSIISTIVATGMNNLAMSKMQVSTMVAFGGLSTVVTVVTGVMFKNEPLYAFHIIGMALILIRMIGVSWIQIKRERNICNEYN